MKKAALFTSATLALLPLTAKAQQKLVEVCTTTKTDMASAEANTHFTTATGDRAEIILKGSRVLVNVAEATQGVREAAIALRNTSLTSQQCAEEAARLNAMVKAGNAATTIEARAAQQKFLEADKRAAPVRDAAFAAARDAYTRDMAPAAAVLSEARERAAALTAARTGAPRVPVTP